MIYSVDVNGERISVDVSPEGVSVNGGPRMDAELSPIVGSPLARLRVGNAIHELVIRERGERGQYGIVIGADVCVVDALDERARAIRALTQATVAASGPAPLRAPMPGLIVRVYVAVGDAVQAGQPLVAMEAMKMENELRAPVAGTVRSIAALPGAAVEKGMVLVALEGNA